MLIIIKETATPVLTSLCLHDFFWDQKVTAPPPYGRWARVPGGLEEEQTYFLVGNN